MGFTNFRVWDHDHVEPHNLPNQAYDLEHVGMKKVDALKLVLERFNPRVKIETHDKYFVAAEDADLVEGILVVAVDSMVARKDIVDVFDGNPMVTLVMESRLGFDFGEVNIIDPMCDEDIQGFRASLFNDEDVPESPCGFRICTTTVNMIASYMVQQICQSKSHERRGLEWQPKKKAVMCFNDEGMTAHMF